jgi:spore maturation protein CgeB
VFGIEMLKALRSGAISFDARGSIGLMNYAEGSGRDLAQKESANMRVFETLGAGTFLLTEPYDNITAMFEPGRELETFADEKELVDKILYYLAHPREREDIARRGRMRCLGEHEMGIKAKLFDSYVRRHIRAASN